MLAASLATAPDHAAAFAAYERDVRGFVELNQALVGEGAPCCSPRRPKRWRAATRCWEGAATPQATGRPEHSAFTLPAFAA